MIRAVIRSLLKFHNITLLVGGFKLLCW